ncbi:putative bifunctional diguanylate cyclase/phosphodiesterase [Oceanimonas sp. CAM02]|uniref:putative bifunctional diguanylate cyclase/phosphodiesterase n=1 Tax=Oceanimonas sp. CAM02 TaxID=3080336 RepID=UPI0029363873|nr:EAL domain-containing protein [Oceanimonas sp. CAM02]MDV2857464.1 EAL domain-containing protein [Oceanimonas sp. CAM02]
MPLPALPQAQHDSCFFRLDARCQLYPLSPLPAGLRWHSAASLAEQLNQQDARRLQHILTQRQASRLTLTVSGQRWLCHLAPVDTEHWLLSVSMTQAEQADRLGVLEWQLQHQWRTTQDGAIEQLPELLELLTGELQPDRIILWRHYEAEELLRPLYSQGLPFALQPVRADRRYWRTLHQRGGLSFSNCAEQPLLGAFDYLATDGIRHRLDVPLPFQSGPGGLLSLEFTQPHAGIPAATMQFVAALAGRIAAVLEQSLALPASAACADDIMTRLMPLLCQYTGQDFFNQLMLQLASLTGAGMVLAGLQHPAAERVHAIACYRQKQLQPAFHYKLEGTPCAFSRRGGDDICIYTKDVAQRFPEDKMLAELGLEAYAGLSVSDQHTQPLGILVLLFEQPLQDQDWLNALLTRLKPRITAEFRHRRDQENLMVAAAAFETREGIFIASANMLVQQANQAFGRMCGTEPESLVGTPVLSLRHNTPGMTDTSIIMETLRSQGWWQGEQCLARTDGHSLPVILRICQMQDGLGITHYVCHIDDISEQKANRDRIEKMAYFDELTGLHNRRFMVEHISHTVALAEHESSRGALLLLDIDDFKNINDSLGYLIGDQLLLRVAERLQGFSEKYDDVSLARMASDEFVLLLPRLGHGFSATKTRAEQLANALQELFAIPFELNGLRLHVSISAGISLFPATGVGLEEYLRQADTATHMAKRIAKGSHVFFSPEMAEEVQERLRLTNDLQQALVNNELVLHFQPQVQLTDQAVVGAEALLRWQPPGKPLVPPGHFIPVAEETSLICDIGNWVLQQACERLQHWHERKQGPEHLSVNISARHFHSPDFVARLEGLLQQYPACRNRLTLEVTEGVILESLSESRTRMIRLKQLGLNLSIDDFGTGYSSFAYLKELPVDELKLDRSFIRNVDSSQRDRAIITCILELARELDMTVVAEGVETESQHNQLLAMNCPSCQGFLLACPMEEADMMHWLAQ